MTRKDGNEYRLFDFLLAVSDFSASRALVTAAFMSGLLACFCLLAGASFTLSWTALRGKNDLCR